MKNQKQTNFGIKLFTLIGQRVAVVASFLIVFGLALCSMDSLYLKNSCQTNKQSTGFKCFLSPIIWNLGSSLFTSAITILAAEIALRDEIIQQIKEAWGCKEATRYIRAFYVKREEYIPSILNSIRQAQPQQEIKLLGLYKEINILNEVGMPAIKDKVLSGCHFKIMILHPGSSVLECLENLDKKELRKFISGNLSGNLKELVKYLEPSKLETSNFKQKGSIEIRLHKNLFSPICYYSASDMKIVWTYFLDSDYPEDPAFEMVDQKLIEDANRHFDHLWTKSVGEDNLLLRIKNNERIINNIERIFP